MHGSDLSGQMCFLGGGDGTLCNECGTGGGEAVRRGWGSVQTAVLSSIPRPCMWVAQSILRCTAWLLLLFSLLCSPLPQSLGVSQDCGDSRIFSPYTNTTYHEIYLILKLPLCGQWNAQPWLTTAQRIPRQVLATSQPLCFRDAQSISTEPNDHRTALPVAAGDLQQGPSTTTKHFSRCFYDMTNQMYLVANCEFCISQLLTLY